jgi:hypothetical protein
LQDIADKLTANCYNQRIRSGTEPDHNGDDAMGIYNYENADFIRKATAEEAARYMELLDCMSQSERDVGAVKGDEFGLPGLTIYMED